METDANATGSLRMDSARSGALDRLLAVLKTPALAADWAAPGDLWEEIKRRAEIHRFSGWLAHATSEWLPSSERPWRDRILMKHHRQHAQRLQSLRQLTEAFGDAGIACVSLKGPLLAERYYPIPFLRPSNDLDLLVYESDIGAAARLMDKLGFLLEGIYPWNLHRRVDKHLDFRSKDDSPRVEVHFRVKAGGVFLAGAEFLDRSGVWRSPSGFECRVLSASDDAFYSGIHAANHAFHRLRWLYDTIRMARSLTAQERSGVWELAVRHGQTGRLVAVSMAAGEFFGESLELDCPASPVPWLWRRLSPRHTRRMVERVEGNTSTFLEKVGCRLDLCRMAGSPLKAAQLLALGADIEIRKRWYALRHPADPGILSRTLPG